MFLAPSALDTREIFRERTSGNYGQHLTNATHSAAGLSLELGLGTRTPSGNLIAELELAGKCRTTMCAGAKALCTVAATVVVCRMHTCGRLQIAGRLGDFNGRS